MNDIALSGLAKQLVQAELLTEKGAQQAWQQAQRNRLSLVSYLVQNKLVKSSQVAEIASEHFGMAFMDLNCLDKETQPKGLVSEKLVRQHHALPLWRRGNKLFVGISDPSNYQAINDIQFSTGLNTEAILVEDDKLTDAIEKFFDTHTSGLEEMADVDLDGVDVEYFSRSTWAWETVECRWPGDLGAKVEKIKMPGFSDKTRAWRFGMRRRGQAFTRVTRSVCSRSVRPTHG